MIGIAIYVLASVILFFLTWVAYLAVMNLKRHKKILPWPAKCIAYPLLAIAYPMDVAVNWLIGSVMFLDPPKEMLFTSRLGRMLQQPGGWRFDIALWICVNLLDPFDPDPDGKHCDY